MKCCLLLFLCGIGFLVAGPEIQGEEGERNDEGVLSFLEVEWAVPKTKTSPAGRLVVDFRKQTVGEESWWSARLRTNATRTLNRPQPGWSTSVRIGRQELVTIVRDSMARLTQREPTARLKYLSLSYHLVLEHEADLHPRLKKVLAEQGGEVQGKHRGIMRKFHDAFQASEALKQSRTALAKTGIPFSEKRVPRMEGDYYTPVDRKLAATWKEAAALPDFGLSYPPTVLFVVDPPDPKKP